MKNLIIDVIKHSIRKWLFIIGEVLVLNNSQQNVGERGLERKQIFIAALA